MYVHFIPFRFNLSFRESTVDDDGKEVDTNEGSSICFSSIAKDANCLDKELEASGFTRKDQEDIEQVQWCVEQWHAQLKYTHLHAFRNKYLLYLCFMILGCLLIAYDTYLISKFENIPLFVVTFFLILFAAYKEKAVLITYTKIIALPHPCFISYLSMNYATPMLKLRIFSRLVGITCDIY